MKPCIILSHSIYYESTNTTSNLASYADYQMPVTMRALSACLGVNGDWTVEFLQTQIGTGASGYECNFSMSKSRIHMQASFAPYPCLIA